MHNMSQLKKYCCSNCSKALFFGEIKEGIVSKDCPKCGKRNVFIVGNMNIVNAISKPAIEIRKAS